MKKELLSLAVISALSLGFTGCGGDSSDTPTDTSNNSEEQSDTSNSIEGTVAVGAALTNAEVTLKDINCATTTATTDSDGTYSLSSSDFAAPYMIKAIAEDGRVLYSYGTQTNGILNVTPLTTYVIDDAARDLGVSSASGVSDLYTNFCQDNTINTDNLEGNIETSVNNINTLLSDELSNVDGFDHFSSAFSADSTGYDGVLDELDIEINEESLILRVDDQILNTMGESLTESNATVSGLITNSGGNGIEDVNISYEYNGNSGYVLTNQNGYYEANVPSYRVLDLEINAEGYSAVNYNNVPTFDGNSISIQLVSLLTTNESTGTGSLSATLIDARTSGTAIPNATVELRSGINNRDGVISRTLTTDEDGTISQSDITSGIYTAKITAEDYYTSYVSVVITNEQTTTNSWSLLGEVVQSETQNGVYASVVLSWGESPSDLDSHITGPKSDNSDDRFQVYFASEYYISDSSNYISDSEAASDYEYGSDEYTEAYGAPCNNNEDISLDRDDRSSYGPETISICNEFDGVYSYYVHNYSGNSSTALESSSARVVLTLENGTTRQYNVPSSNDLNDEVWHVFDLNTTSGQITNVNKFLSDSSNIRSIRDTNELNLFKNLPSK